MRKRNKTICLGLAALSAVSLSSCNDVSENKEGKVITYTYNDGESSISTEDIMKKYLNENRNDHAKAFYDALYEVVVRANFEKGGLLASYKSKVEDKTSNYIESEKDTAEKNGTSWDDYLINLGYDEENLSTADREHLLYVSNIYTQMKEVVNDQFYETFKSYTIDSETDATKKAAQEKYNLINGSEGYLEKYVPYHVRHILIKNDASQDYGYSHGHISSDNAQKIYNVFTALANGDTFSDVANRFTDDPGNESNGKKNGGEYIMRSTESFVNEFKLGTYTYDVLLEINRTNDPYEYDFSETSTIGKSNSNKLDKLYIPEDVEEEIKNFGVTFIPYGVISEINDVKDKTTYNGEKVYEGDEDYLPRNILFNKYFQNRNIAFVTNEDAFTTNDLIGQANWDSTSSASVNGNNFGFDKRTDGVSGKQVYTDISDSGHYETSRREFPGLSDAQKENFKEIKVKIDGVDVPKKVLCDNNGNPIMVVRNIESSGGIHLIVIERSAFDVTGEFSFNKTTAAEAGIQSADYSKYYTSLNEYYAPITPKDENGIDSTTGNPKWVSSFPHVENDSKILPKKTYVQTTLIGPNSVVDDTVSNYTTRANNIADQIKETVKDYNKYEWLNDSLNIKLNDVYGVNVQSMVEKYIAKDRASSLRDTRKTMEDSWTNYSQSIKKQTNERKYMLLPEILATDFGNPELYKQGQPGYNSKYYDVTNNINK